MVPFLTNHKLRRTTTLLGIVLILALLLAAGGTIHAQESVWNAWYWNNTDLSGEPALHRTEQQVGLDIGFFSPAEGIDAEDFSARWTNVVEIENAGSYTFWARVDDGVRVWVDGSLVIDDWEPQAVHTVSANTTLSEGSHEIRVEYFDSRDAALLEFRWGPEGTISPGEEDQGDRPPAQADGDGEFSADVVTATTTVNLNLRDAPSLQGEILTTLPRGSSVGFTGFMDANGEWVQVDAADGPVGWVAARFLSNVPEGLQVPGEAPAAEAASSVTVEDQDLGDDGMVTIPRVESEVDGWLVIHADSDGAPGPVIGQEAVSAGINENVSVEIDTEAATPTLYAMLHADTGEMGVYEFPDADPPVRVDEQVVVRPFMLTDMAAEAPSSVTVEDQDLGDDGTVTVPRVESEAEGWLVIHADDNGSPGPVIGQEAVSAGINENVSVEIDTAAATPTLYAMLHADTGLMGVYEFPEDDLPVVVDGEVVVQPFTLTDMAADEGADTFPADVVTATTTVNLNLRDGPGLQFTILDTLPAGSTVGFTGFQDASGEWVQVDAADGPVGWVAARFLSNVPDDLQVFEGGS